MFGRRKKELALLTDMRDALCNLEYREFDIIEYLLEILRLLNRPTRAILTFQQGDLNMPGTTSVTLNLSPTASVVATFAEFNADGSVFTLDPTKLTFVAQDSTIVSVTSNDDGTATVKPLAVGTTSVGCTDSATGLTAVGSVTVAAVVVAGPTTATLTFNSPTA